MTVDTFLCRMLDHYFSLRPQKKPRSIGNVKLVSHRGEHDNHLVLENTLAAFDAAAELGAWGIELDIRWTKDAHPVVIHDLDCKRMFGCDLKISQVTLAELKERLPEIPTLLEVIERYGKSLHLMIELKMEPYLDNFSAVLYDLLGELKPVRDYHFLSLDLSMFSHVDGLQSSVCLPVAEKNIAEFSRAAVENNYGGITGHFFLLTDTILRLHQETGQCIGTGFITSPNCLFREINRGVTWIFTNSMGDLSRHLVQNNR